MNRMKAIVLAAGLTLAAALAPARADVIFTFTQTGGSPAGGVSVGGTLRVTDAAYANGLESSILIGGGNVISSGFDDILDLSLTLSAGGFSIGLSKADLLSAASFPPGTLGAGALLSDPAGLPFGGLALGSPVFGFSVALLGDSFSGIFTSGVACRPFRGGPCTFSGETTVAVPEPVSLAMFGAGLLGLAGVRRMRKRAVAA